jgi:hypothetical protein
MRYTLTPEGAWATLQDGGDLPMRETKRTRDMTKNQQLGVPRVRRAGTARLGWGEAGIRKVSCDVVAL